MEMAFVPVNLYILFFWHSFFCWIKDRLVIRPLRASAVVHAFFLPLTSNRRSKVLKERADLTASVLFHF